MGWRDRAAQLWTSLKSASRREPDTGPATTGPDPILGPSDAEWDGASRDHPTTAGAGAEVDEELAFRQGVVERELRVYAFRVAFDSELRPSTRVLQDGTWLASEEADALPGETLLAGQAATAAKTLADAVGAAFKTHVDPEFVLTVRGGRCWDASDPERVANAEASRRSAQLIEAMIAHDGARFDSVLALAASEAESPEGVQQLAAVAVGFHDVSDGPEDPSYYSRRFGDGDAENHPSVMMTPLDVAAKMGRVDCIEALLPLSVCSTHLLFDKRRRVLHDPYAPFPIAPDSPLCDLDHGSALLAAAVAGHADCVKLLWKPHQRHENFNAAEVLTAAMHSGSRETIDTVLSFTDPTARDWFGRDAFANAVGVGDLVLAEEFRSTADLNAGEGYALRAACLLHERRAGQPDDRRAMALAESIVDGVDRVHIAAIADTIATRHEKKDLPYASDTEQERAQKQAIWGRRDDAMDLLASKSVIAAARTGRFEQMAQRWEAEKASDAFVEPDALTAAIRSMSMHDDRMALDAVLERTSPNATDRFGRDGLANAIELGRLDVAYGWMKRVGSNWALEQALHTACRKHEREGSDDVDKPFLKIASRLAAHTDPEALERIGDDLLERQARHEREAGNEFVGEYSEFEFNDLAVFQKRREALVDALAPRCSETFQGCVLEKFGAEALPATARETERRELARVMSEAQAMAAHSSHASQSAVDETAENRSRAATGAAAPSTARVASAPQQKARGARRM